MLTLVPCATYTNHLITWLQPSKENNKRYIAIKFSVECEMGELSSNHFLAANTE